MHDKRRSLVSIFIACSLAVLAGNARSATEPDAQTSDAWQALKSGHAVILMRHALAPGIGDPAEFDLKRCSTQRNLSDAGRRQARAIGEELRANGIENATVLSSEWCRCMETASLLELGVVEPASMLNSFFESRESGQDQTHTLKETLDAWLPGKGEVRILVTHQVNITSLTGQFAGSGDMLIVTMDDGEPVVLAKIATD